MSTPSQTPEIERRNGTRGRRKTDKRRIEEEHPFAVRLGWIALLVTIAGLILAVWSYHHFDQNARAIRATQQQQDVTQRSQAEYQFNSCVRARKARFISIQNYKQEINLYTYVHTIAEHGVTAARLVVNNSNSTPAAKAAAELRLDEDGQLANVVPHIVIPDPIAPCGTDPALLNLPFTPHQ